MDPPNNIEISADYVSVYCFKCVFLTTVAACQLSSINEYCIALIIPLVASACCQASNATARVTIHVAANRLELSQNTKSLSTHSASYPQSNSHSVMSRC